MTWVSRSESDGDAFYAGRSQDAGHVIFSSVNNITPLASGSGPKLYDWHNGVVTLVSIKPDGTTDPDGATLGGRPDDPAGNSQQAFHAVSDDGNRIFFSSPSLTAATPENPTRLYVRIGQASTVEVSGSQCTRSDCNAASDAAYVGATADGKHVYFTTAQQLVNEDTDDQSDLYTYDVDTGALQRLSSGLGALPPTVLGTTMLGTSDDGSRVYFFGLRSQLLVWDHGQLRQIASLLDHDELGATHGCQDPSGFGIPEVTPDGRILVFGAVTLVRTAGGPSEEGLFRYDAQSNALVQLASSGSLPSGHGASLPDCYLNRGITDDGSSVFFTTVEALDPRDVNGLPDVYEWNNGSISLLSSGVSDRADALLGVSASGQDVYFTTFDQLVPQDRDVSQDIYDARLGGGVPQSAGGQSECSGEDCLGASSNSPSSFDLPGSLNLLGPGNLKPASTKKFSKSSSNSQKLKRALRACKSKRGKAKRRKCEHSARRRFGKSGGSK
jgi:hypothetical protein